MNNWFKRNSIHFIIAAILLVVCFLYFTPAFQGKTLGQSDVIGAQSTQKEINDYKAKDTTILWTNQIFGGMPAFQIWAPYPLNVTTHVVSALKAVFPNPVDTVLLLLFGAYFLFSVLKINPWLAAAGALAFTFSSYNIILIAAGHSNQAFAIALFAPILASIILTLRGNYLLGGSLTALFLAIEIRANHVQMTYYLLLVLIILVGIELYHAVKNKLLPAFLKALAFLGAATLLALAVNASLLWSTYEYGKETIRGQSNLKQHTKQPSDGLAKDYAYEYSQTVGETFTFLVPNVYGGETGLASLDVPNSETVKALSSVVQPDQLENAVQQLANYGLLNTYWGDKPLTSGPHYMGAIICFLFILGLFIVKNRIKWWLLASVVLTILLSFGNSFPYVSDLFFNYFPLYNKFRAIESILSVTGLCIPLLAILAIQEIVTSTDKGALFKNLKLAFYITGGIALLLIITPELFLSFKPSNQLDIIKGLTQVFKGSTETAQNIAKAMVNDRIGLERGDAIRAFIFILLAFGLIWAFIKEKINVAILSFVFLGLIVVDLWQVDKRFLKESNFQDKVDAAQAVQPREVDTFIARDTDPDFRVLDLTQGLKQDRFNPFFHKSISGYSAARLKRYDELIDGQLSANPVNHDVLDMLNTKYIINADTGRNFSMRANNTACGHAWFVKSVKFVDNADQEMQAISSFAPKDEAIVDKRFKSILQNEKLAADPNATIKLTHYNPDHLTYETGATANGIAVFSEIYYDKGWTMLIDGKESPYFRADYILRAAEIPVGNHKIEFVFHPASYYTGEKVSLAGSILMILALGGAAFTELRKKKPSPVPAEPVQKSKK